MIIRRPSFEGIPLDRLEDRIGKLQRFRSSCGNLACCERAGRELDCRPLYLLSCMGGKAEQ